MEDNANFTEELQKKILQKTDWYNNTEFIRMLEKYRLLYSCVKNLYDLLIQKNIIQVDPYRFDKKISEITVPETGPFNENDKSIVIGTRFSDYYSMLDFVCTYTRFSVDNINLPKIKKLQELNTCFNWEEMSSNSTKPNTRGLYLMINEARANSPQIVQSMVNDHMSRCSQTVAEINQMLNQLIRFQRELYKLTIRKDLLEHPSFNTEKAMESSENELSEIKRIFAEAMGKKPFYTELVNEIINEDQAPNKNALRAEVMAKLEIKDTVKKAVKKSIDTKELLMNSVLVLGALPPTYHSFIEKMEVNNKLLHTKNNSFFSKLLDTLRKAFGIRKNTEILKVPFMDPVTKHKTTKEIQLDKVLSDINKKERLYSGIAAKGSEYSKIQAASEDQILSFLGKQISENQNMYNTIAALDDYFKTAVAPNDRPKVKGMKLDLDTMRNTIINCNKKRGEYQAFIEEAEQMKKLGIEND